MYMQVRFNLKLIVNLVQALVYRAGVVSFHSFFSTHAKLIPVPTHFLQVVIIVVSNKKARAFKRVNKGGIIVLHSITTDLST